MSAAAPLVPDMSELSPLEVAVRTGGADSVIRPLQRKGQLHLLPYIWRGANARPKQLAPAGDWATWLVLAGRGFGKTRTGAEWIRERIRDGKAKRIALIGATAADVRDTMVEGESGLLNVWPPGERPVYLASKRKVIFPKYPGVVAYLYSAETPRQLRGPQHDTVWGDEVFFWQRPETLDMARFGLRIGTDPRMILTSTPRPGAMIRELLADPSCVTTRGSTYDNAGNLHPAFIRAIRAKYEGTNLGRQELYAEVLDAVEGALWNVEMLEGSRWRSHMAGEREILWPHDGEFDRIVVGVDPAVSSGAASAETGIVVCGMHGRGADARYYALEDFSIRGTPGEWAKRVVQAYQAWDADLVVGEVNNGGDLVEHTLRSAKGAARIPYKAVRATRGKAKRAEPISALWEQGRASVVNTLARLEDQMRTYVPGAEETGESPDRMDAMVWAMTELTGGITKAGRMRRSAISSGGKTNKWRAA